MKIFNIFAFATLAVTAAPALAQTTRLDCVISTKLIYVRESDREKSGLIVPADTEMRVSNCESDNLCIVHYPVYGEEMPAFVDSRDLVACFDARFKGRSIINRDITPRPYKGYTRPTIR